MSTQVAERPKTVADLSGFVASRIKQIKSVVASNVTPEKMARIALNELRTNDFLAKCAVQNPDAFINAIVQASHLGLEIGGALGQAYLVPFKGEVKMMPGYRGLLSLARRSGEITSINAEVVYERDEFSLELGLESKVTHKPYLQGERGEPVLAYMVAHFKDGGHHFEWMSITEVYKTRDRSSAVQSAKKNGKQTPWDTDRDEMIRKTVIRRGWKYLPMSIEMQHAKVIDDAAEAGKTAKIETIEGEATLIIEDPQDDTPEEKKLPAIDQEKWNKGVADVIDEDGVIKRMGWRSSVQSGDKSADDVIAFLSQKYTLTDAQTAEIKSWSQS